MRCQRPILDAITIAVACTWLATIALGARAQAPSAGDWPQFRGGPALGLVAEAALPLAWDKSPGSKGKIVWRSAIPGAGWSQPVSVDGRIYLTTAVIPGGRSPGQVRANAAAADLPPLDARTIAAVQAIYDDAIRPLVHHRW